MRIVKKKRKFYKKIHNMYKVFHENNRPNPARVTSMVHY